jgi:SAM-dependent methyltransferase
MNKEAYRFIQEQEKSHWWFVGRRLVIGSILHQYIKKKTNTALDIGSGFGEMFPLLLSYTNSLDSIEPLKEARDVLLKKGAGAVLEIKNFPVQIPDQQYDLITMFDVLEHIENHKKALIEINKKLLNPFGRLVITVPAYQWLWSDHDVSNHHKRRYHRNQLSLLLHEAGFRVIRISYFMTILFPLSIFQRAFIRYSSTNEEYGSVHPLINSLLKVVFSWESIVIPFISFPFGLSIIAIVEK